MHTLNKMKTPPRPPKRRPVYSFAEDVGQFSISFSLSFIRVSSPSSAGAAMLREFISLNTKHIICNTTFIVV